MNKEVILSEEMGWLLANLLANNNIPEHLEADYKKFACAWNAMPIELRDILIENVDNYLQEIKEKK